VTRVLHLALVALAVASVARADDKPRAERIVRVEHRDPLAAPAKGPVDAPVIVEMFFVPQWGQHQTRLNNYKALEALQQRHPTRMRLIWRVQRQGMHSTAALEAHAQGKFFEFLDKLHAERLAISREKLLEIAKSVGVDPDRVSAAIDQDRYLQTFDDNQRRSSRLHIVNYPVVVFNSTIARFSMTSNVKPEELERTYAEAYARAMELIDQGVPPSRLGEAFDAKVLASVSTSPIAPADDDNESHDQMLVSPPIDVTGLPSVGDDTTSMPIIFLCSTLNTQCQKIIEKAITLQKDVYPELRLIWAPWFDVGREDAGDHAQLGYAALCAEELGTGAPPKSAGWLWVEAMHRQIINTSRRGRMPIQDRIDAIAKELDVDTARLYACTAKLAAEDASSVTLTAPRATMKRIEAARQSGVRVSPSVIIGGRMYAALGDPGILQQLIEAELAPGISDILDEHLGRWPR